MTHPSEVAKRYAHAFYTVVLDQYHVEDILKDFKVLEVVLTSPIPSMSQNQNTLFHILAIPLLLLKEKEALIDHVFQENTFKLSQNVVGFLKFLLYKNRMVLILEIISAFRNKHDQQQNVVRGQVFTPYDLTTDEKKHLKDAISHRIPKHIHLEYLRDSSILGGILVKVESLLFDGTITHQLDLLEHHLIHSK